MSEAYNPKNNNDGRNRKIFVGGLAWETERDSLKRYFQQFGDILEAVVITDRTSARSKGYGFVTFKEEEAAKRACQNPSPVIDGRRANCNIASFGFHNKTPQYVDGAGSGRFRSAAAAGLMGTPPTYHPLRSSSSPPYFHHHPCTQPPFPYYGYTGYSHDNMYNMNYYGGYGQQEAISPYYYPTTTTVGAGGRGVGSSSGTIGYFHNMYPYSYINTYAQSSQGYGYGVQYPQPHQMIPVQQYHFYPQHFTPSSSPILSLPSSTSHFPTSFTTTTTITVIPTTGVRVLADAGSAGATKTATGSTSEQNAGAKTSTASICEQNAAT